MAPVNEWTDYARTGGLLSVTNFSPSTRQVTFDVHVDSTNLRVYIVVRVALEFTKGAGAGGWNSTGKTQFKKYLKAAASVLDAGVQLVSPSGQSYTPKFLIDIQSSKTHLKIIANTLSTEATRMLSIPNQLPPGGSVTFGSSTYPARRPSPTSSTKHAGVVCRVSALAVRNFDINGTICNSFVHELGHIIGLPDEYDLFPPSGGIVPAAAPTTWGNKDRSIFYWVLALQEAGITLPGWGHFGVGTNLQNDHSLMRDVAVDTGSLKPRHYVSILEGVQHVATRNSSISGVWTMA